MPMKIKIVCKYRGQYQCTGLTKNLENLILASGSNGYSKSENLKNR
jgi:hypothetical protein